MKRLLGLFLVLAMALSLISCSSFNVLSGLSEKVEETAEQSNTSSNATDDISEEPEEVFDWTNINPLTGEHTETDVSNNRPIAVMLNDIYQALPQSGNSKADIIYEVPEEGGVTRMLAMYQDITDVGSIGTVRSARPYYVRLALASDAIFVHAGGSHAAYRAIKKYMDLYGMVDIDYLEKGTNYAESVFFRDTYRLNNGYASEHTLFTNSDNIQNYLEDNSDDIRLEHKDSFKRTHMFEDDVALTNGSDADTIEVEFSGYKSTYFGYDSDFGKYFVKQIYPTIGSNAAYMDGSSGEQVNVENVIVIRTKIENTNDYKGRLAIYLTGEGSGYYACNGKIENITWTKDKLKHSYSFYDKNGDEVVLSTGNSFVCIVGENYNVSVDGETLDAD